MRNVFVSYSHRLDQSDADNFRRKFGDSGMVFSDRSLENLDIGYLSDDTIKDNYIRPKIRQSSVTIVLIGKDTGGRNLKKIKGVIFDLDGTLLSSTDVWRKIDVEFLGKRGLEVPEDYVETITPMEFKQIADYTIERFHLAETPEAVMDEWNTMAKDAYENKVQIKPGVKELLTALKKGNIPMAVATSNIEALYKPCLKRNGILEYFDAFTE